MKPMTLRLPDELHLALQGEANRQGRSLHGHIIRVLRGSVTVFVPTQVHTVVIPPSHPPETPWPLRMPQAVSPPLDAIPPDAKKGVHERFIEVHTAGDTKRVDVCTCGAGERAKGRHNKYCPLRGK